MSSNISSLAGQPLRFRTSCTSGMWKYVNQCNRSHAPLPMAPLNSLMSDQVDSCKNQAVCVCVDDDSTCVDRLGKSCCHGKHVIDCIDLHISAFHLYNLFWSNRPDPSSWSEGAGPQDWIFLSIFSFKHIYIAISQTINLFNIFREACISNTFNLFIASPH